MSNEDEWMPPGSSPSPGGSPQGAAPLHPPVVAGQQPAYGPPQGTAPAAPTGSPLQPPPLQQPIGSWTAPPKPGLIPLRPLTLGNIMAGSFQVLRRNPRPTFGFAFGVQAVIMVLTMVIVGVVSFLAAGRTVNASAADFDEIMTGAVFITLLSSLIPLILSMIAMALVQGILMLEIQRSTLGEKSTLRQLWRRARGRLGALIGWMSLLTLIMLVGLAVLAGFIVLLALLGPIGIALAVIVGIFGGLGLLVVGMWLGTKVSLVPSVLMGERLPLWVAVRRSWSLVSGYFWRTLGIQLLISTIISFAIQVIAVPVQLLAPMAILLIDPNGTGGPVTMVVLVGIYLVSALIVLVLTAIALVVQSSATGLIYIDLRMRKEGLDLDLARYVEETTAGYTSADPYLVSASAQHAGAPAPTAETVSSQNESQWA